MRNTLYALVAATTFGMATPALAEYKVGDEMPNYKENTHHLQTFLFSIRGETTCKGNIKEYINGNLESEFLAFFSPKGLKEESPYLIFDFNTNEYLFVSKKESDSQETIDEIIPFESMPRGKARDTLISLCSGENEQPE